MCWLRCFRTNILRVSTIKLIDMLYKKGLINEATYFNVKRTYQNK